MRPVLPPDWLTHISQLPADGGPSGAAWAGTVGRLVDEAIERWSLTVTAEPWTGYTAVVFPVESDGRPLALKVVWPHPEAAGEHLALRVWGGHGAVRLVAAEPSTGSLLLERLDASRTLNDLPIDEACAVIGAVLAQLHVPAPGSILPLSHFVGRHLETLQRAGPGLPRRIIERTLGIADELSHDHGAARLLHTDLHYDNVLAGERETGRHTWLAIDPKPMAGHPGYEIQPLLRNRIDELGTGAHFRAGIRRRLDIVTESAGIDPEAARLWSLVHTGLQIGWATAVSDPAELSRQIAIFKALDG